MKASLVFTYVNDYDTFWAVMTQLRWYNDLRDFEIIVLDQLPDSPMSPKTQRHCETWDGKHYTNIRYEPYPSPMGVGPARNRAFETASCDFVFVFESHVIPGPGWATNLSRWLDENSETTDMIVGPYQSDRLEKPLRYTHLNCVWDDFMWGKWGTTYETPDGVVFSTMEKPDDKDTIQFVELEPGITPIKDMPNLHKKHLNDFLNELRVKQRGLTPDDELYIPAHGSAIFGCNKKSWQGYDPNFRGSGGADYYMHMVHRLAGYRTRCVGFLPWVHRFDDPHDARARLRQRKSLTNAIRNYGLAFKQLDAMGISPDILDKEAAKKCFVGPHGITRAQWDATMLDPVKARYDIPRSAIPKDGYGSEFKTLAKEGGLEFKKGCTCEALKEDMNLAGPLCKDPEKREHFIRAIKKNAKNWGWTEQLMAGIKLRLKGVKLNPRDPVPDLYDEAIRRYDERVAKHEAEVSKDVLHKSQDTT